MFKIKFNISFFKINIQTCFYRFIIAGKKYKRYKDYMKIP